MSMLLMAKAMQLQVGSTAQKMVLLKLADNANDKGECFPSYETIARHCEISRQSAINHIKSLCKKGFVRKITRKTDKGHTSNLYILDLEAKSLDEGSQNTVPPSQNSVPEVVKEFDHGSQTVGLGVVKNFYPEPVSLLTSQLTLKNYRLTTRNLQSRFQLIGKLKFLIRKSCKPSTNQQGIDYPMPNH